MKDTPLARLFQGGDHWQHYDLAAKWREAVKAMAVLHPEAARCACEWSLFYFGLYNEAWEKGLPASRWDSDGGSESMEVQALMDSLGANADETALPEWAEALLGGDYRSALAAAGEAPAGPEWGPLEAVLGVARKALWHGG